MPRTLYNEGRVVGYSAYEMYVRHHLSVAPNTTPASEKEWLASMMAMGSSMLLKIAAEEESISGAHYIEVDFPSNSRLCAANNIIASFFGGTGYVNGTETGWATKVTDYGPLISNTALSSPNETTIPAANVTSLPVETINQIREYMKILDGIVIQPGTWTVNPNNPPQKDFKPTLSSVPKLRILLSSRIEKSFYIVLTGFTNRTVVDGQTGFDSAANTQSSEDGDFLGPWAFPWSAKIFFSVPSSFVNYFITNKYARKLPVSNESVSVTSDPIIDMKSGNPKSFYTSKFHESKQNITVTDINTMGEDAAIFATFSKTENLPPALYGSLISQKDDDETDNIIYPIDNVAPGTVKLYQEDSSVFSDISTLQTYITNIENSVPFNYGMYRECDSALIMHRDPVLKKFIPISNDETVNLAGLCTYNTEYVWFHAMGAGGGYPTHEQMNNITSFIIARGWSGYVSQEFIENFCIPLNELINNLDNYKDSSGIEHISGFYSNIPDSERKNYGVAIMSKHESFTEPSQQYSGLLVRLDDGTISQVDLSGSNGVELPFGLNFNNMYTEESGYSSVATKYLGTWWSSSGSYMDDDNKFIFQNHNTTHTAIPDYAHFYQNASVPTASPTHNKPTYDKYGNDFRAWFKYTPMSTLLSDLGMTWNDCTWKDGDITKYVHKDYRNLSILAFIMKVMTRKDLSKADTSNNARELNTETQYLFPKSALRTSKPWTNKMVATAKLTASHNQVSFYQPTLWKISEKSDNHWDDKTEEYVRPDSTIWASVGTSGYNQATSISLVDKNGAQLPTQGTGGIIDGDYLIWSDLLSALNQNRKIDILESVLRGLKINVEESGPNFIKLKNSPRLYIADSAHIPDDADIPDGSIGIGW